MRKLNKSRHSRYLLNFHIVWIPKYRRSVLDGYQDELKDILYSIADKKQWEILAVEVMPDHVHLFVSVPPTIAPCEVVKPSRDSLEDISSCGILNLRIPGTTTPCGHRPTLLPRPVMFPVRRLKRT